MAREHIRSTEDIQRYIETSDHKKSELIRCRNKVINRLRREKNPERISELKAERTRLTGEISEIRKSIRTAEFTLDRSEKVRNDIKIELSYCQGNIHRSQKRDSKNRGVGR
jgi:small-conductance mechanosensitive channel